MTSDRDRHLANLSPAEWAIYTRLGGEAVTHRMEVDRARAAFATNTAPSPEFVEAVSREKLPRGRTKAEKPLIYQPGRPSRREPGKKRSRKAA